MIHRLRQVSIPILAKITVPYIFLAFLIAFGGIYLVTNLVVDTVEERFTNQLIEAGLLASEAMVRTEEDLLEQLRLISFLGGMAEAVDGGHAAMITELSLPVAYSSDVEAFAMVNGRNRSLVALRFDAEQQLYVPLETEIALGEMEFIANVLSGEIDAAGDKFAGFVQAADDLYLFVAGPVEDASGNVVGAALVGNSINALTRTVREETLAQVSFYRLDGTPLVSTLNQSQPVDANQASEVVARQEEGSLARELVDSAIDYRELLTTWEVRGQQDVGIMGIALPTTFITDANQLTRANVLVLMAVTMVLVVLIGIVVAGHITRPIHALRDAAAQVAEGDLGVKVPPSTRDELGVLTLSFNNMVESLGEAKRDQLDTYDRTIEGWAHALDLRDHETEGHSRRVTAMAVALAREIGMGDEELEHLRRGALLHDIGKIAVPDRVLLKEGKLNAEERVLIEKHPVHARQFMEQVEFLAPALDIPYYHHERWDGNGYPEGLKGTDIPLAARVFAVVDVWDALTSDRPYRKAMTKGKAISIVQEDRGTHFDPEVVDVFLQMVEEHHW